VRDWAGEAPMLLRSSPASTSSLSLGKLRMSSGNWAQNSGQTCLSFLGKARLGWKESVTGSPPRKCRFQRPSFWWSHPSAAQPLWSTKSSMNLGFLSLSLGRFPVFHRFRMTLWPAATSLHPELLQLRRALEDIPSLGVGMSGSGPTLFLAFSSAEEAEAARQRIRLPAEVLIARPVDCGYKIVG
jgi:hypothetical protein